MVFIMMPPDPTAYPVLESVKKTEYKLLKVPLDDAIHVLPPLMVLNMVPISSDDIACDRIGKINTGQLGIRNL